MAKKRSLAQIAADAAYRASNPGFLLRLSLHDMKALDKARGRASRPEWAKEVVLAAIAKAKRPR